MSIRYYNTYSRRAEPFEAIEPGTVRLYSCGPTVHDFAHVGNFRAFVFVDLLKRHLEFRGLAVRHVMNITDVGHMTTDGDAGEDKIGKSAREKGMDPWELVEHFTAAFLEDCETLRIEPAMHYPRATDHVPDMIAMVRRILANGFAYEANGSVYFDLRKFPAYGALSGNTLEQLREGHRVEVNPDKRFPLDFALWKAAPTSVMHWQSPWSVGVPGWHIECTAMASRYLGEQLDIHTGGHDNIFPHHESEIAQFEAATGKHPYVRVWMHNAHLRLVHGGQVQKMAKSLGNFHTVRSLVEAGHSPVALRYLLLSSHYRAPLNFSLEGLDAAAKAVGRINDFVARLDEAPEAGPGPDVAPLCDKALADFGAALDDDLNISAALGALFDLMHQINRLDLTAQAAATVRKAMAAFDSVLGVLEAPDDSLDADIQRLVDERQAARKARDFARADAIRDQLRQRGILLEDTPQGVRWRRT